MRKDRTKFSPSISASRTCKITSTFNPTFFDPCRNGATRELYFVFFFPVLGGVVVHHTNTRSRTSSAPHPQPRRSEDFTARPIATSTPIRQPSTTGGNDSGQIPGPSHTANVQPNVRLEAIRQRRFKDEFGGLGCPSVETDHDDENGRDVL